MRTHLFLLLMIFSFTLSKAQWVEIAPGVDNALYDIYAITPDIVVAVGDNGTIIKTIDGGETWQQKESGTSNRLTKRSEEHTSELQSRDHPVCRLLHEKKKRD